MAGYDRKQVKATHTKNNRLTRAVQNEEFFFPVGCTYISHSHPCLFSADILNFWLIKHSSEACINWGHSFYDNLNIQFFRMKWG